MKLKLLVGLLLVVVAEAGCSTPVWPELWKSYTAGFMDDQVRVIDRDAADRATSEAQAYGMFFALVANDRDRFDGLLGWTERNLASGDLGLHLPAWWWGRTRDGEWRVLDANSASDADVWFAYTLLEAGRMWNEPRYTAIGAALADRIASTETAEVPGFGSVLLPGASGFRHENAIRLNASYLPLQLFLRLAKLQPSGPWQRIADRIPDLVRSSAPHGFVSDWTDVGEERLFKPSPICSYDAIRVYLWAGMLDPKTPRRDDLLEALSGMRKALLANPVPPAKVNASGSVVDPNGPIGFSAALVPYLSALGETDLARQQLDRLRAAADQNTLLYGTPARYYDQNLALFGIGFVEKQFGFDAAGALRTRWHD